MLRIGQGFDVHRLGDNRLLIIGGIKIPFGKGLEGHSDGDVLTHAICNALLGAIGMSDICQHFPDTDERYKNIDSQQLLIHVSNLLRKKEYAINNIDSTIIAQAPKLAPHIQSMREKLAHNMQIEINQINIKATTTEKLGYTGRGEGIAAEAVVLLNKIQIYSLIPYGLRRIFIDF